MNEAFLQSVRDIQPRLSTLRCRVIPSSFDPADPALLGIPQPAVELATFAQLLAAAKPRGVMMRLPPFWQATTPLHVACHAHGAAVFFNDIANMPLGARALTDGCMDLVVSEAVNAAEFARFCIEKTEAAVKAWYVIHRADAPEWLPLEHARGAFVAHEVQVFPGVPVLEQCSDLMAKNEPRFHLSRAYQWTLEPAAAFITSIADEPLPLRNYQLPFSLRHDGECACGQAFFSRA